MKELILYFSKAGENDIAGETVVLEKGNTEALAEMIKDITDGDMFKIEPVKPYSEALKECIKETAAEKKAGIRPEAKAVPAVDGYDIITLMFPNYHGTMPMVMFTVLEQLNLDGKYIRPVCTHEGDGAVNSLDDIKRLAPRADVTDILEMKGSHIAKKEAHVAEDLKAWLSATDKEITSSEEEKKLLIDNLIDGFDAAEVKNQVVQWIYQWFDENGPECRAVVGISGGKDSSVVAALCVEALGKDRVFGVLMPQGKQADIDSSYTLVKHLGIDHAEVNIGDTVDALVNSLTSALDVELTKQTLTNLPARLRMAAVYAVSQSMNGRVANTCNLSEDWVGYSTRYGDAAGDFSPLSNLTVAEVKAIGRELGLPDILVDKVPIDGLSGKTDEDNLGFTYNVLDRYIRTGFIEDLETKKMIDRKRRQNKFKLMPIPAFSYGGKIKAEDD